MSRLLKARSWLTGARILGCCGLASSLVGCCGGFRGASFIMLVGNLCALCFR